MKLTSAKFQGTLLLSFAEDNSVCAELISKKSLETHVTPCLSTKMADSAPCQCTAVIVSLWLSHSFIRYFNVICWIGCAIIRNLHKILTIFYLVHYFLPHQNKLYTEISFQDQFSGRKYKFFWLILIPQSKQHILFFYTCPPTLILKKL